MPFDFYINEVYEIMNTSTFDFLQELNPKLVQLGRDIEKIFYEDPHGVLIKGRLFAEQLTKQVASLEGMEELNYLRQVERVEMLDREGLLTKEVSKALDAIRTIGNRAAHQNGKADLEEALKIHKHLFKVSVWFMEVYGSHNFSEPIYRHPPIKKSEGIDQNKITALIQSTLSKQLAELLKQQYVPSNDINHSENPSKEEELLQENSIENSSGIILENKKLHGSYLLYQLSKLKESSQEAIENSNSFSEFKKYLHVKRPIQIDLENAMEEAAKQDGSKLIFLCGSVGDGKSHLLAYMKHSKPELMSKFKIHNDATESFDPQKSSLDTLAEILKPFSDDNIKLSNEKLVLAINLGVLHNFLESKYVMENFNMLAKFIEETKLFESEYISENYSDQHFSLISFSDYHPFELTKEGPKSDYFTKLIEKIVQPTADNPFYAAYLQDKEEKVEGPFMINYRLLQNKEVQEKLVQLLIRAVVQYKYILSTRSLLNFIYDIIVPANLEDLLTSTSVIEELEVLIPNLLFESKDRSPLLKIMAQLDPIHVRSDSIDQALIELNNSTNISMVFKRHLDLEQVEYLENALVDLGPFYELTTATRQLLTATLIRFTFFLSKDMSSAFENETYTSFMSYLYAYNVGVPNQLRGIYEDIENAIFAWQGGPKPNYIYVDNSVGSMKIAQSLNLRKYSKHLIKRDDEILNRFKNTIIIGFQNQSQTEHVLLEIDYPLYETIIKVLKGYRPNKKDKEDAIQFTEFIDRLKQLGNKGELFISDKRNNLLFKLEYDPDFEEFSFKRE